jgi:hypothetical protein
MWMAIGETNHPLSSNCVRSRESGVGSQECKFNKPELLWGGHLARPVNEVKRFTGRLIHDPNQLIQDPNQLIQDPNQLILDPDLQDPNQQPIAVHDSTPSAPGYRLTALGTAA